MKTAIFGTPKNALFKTCPQTLKTGIENGCFWTPHFQNRICNLVWGNQKGVILAKPEKGGHFGVPLFARYMLGCPLLFGRPKFAPISYILACFGGPFWGPQMAKMTDFRHFETRDLDGASETPYFGCFGC